MLKQNSTQPGKPLLNPSPNPTCNTHTAPITIPTITTNFHYESPLPQVSLLPHRKSISTPNPEPHEVPPQAQHKDHTNINPSDIQLGKTLELNPILTPNQGNPVHPTQATATTITNPPYEPSSLQVPSLLPHRHIAPMKQQTDATTILQLASAKPNHAAYLTCTNDNNCNNNNNDNHNKYNDLFLNEYNDELFFPILQQDAISAFSRLHAPRKTSTPIYMRDLPSTFTHAPEQGFSSGDTMLGDEHQPDSTPANEGKCTPSSSTPTLSPSDNPSENPTTNQTGKPSSAMQPPHEFTPHTPHTILPHARSSHLHKPHEPLHPCTSMTDMHKPPPSHPTSSLLTLPMSPIPSRSPRHSKTTGNPPCPKHLTHKASKQ
jgi:hypothetical protein